MDAANKITSMGVRGRLLLAFLGISMFSLVAAASGLYSLSQVGGALKNVQYPGMIRIVQPCPDSRR